jgi:hypothetical protein
MYGARSVTVLAALALVAAGGLAGARSAHAEDFVPVTLSGFAFEDRNGDGIFDPVNESLQDGFIVNLSDGSTVLQQAFTWGGQFAFSDVGPGTFYVYEEPFGDWFTGAYTVTTSSGVNVGDLVFANFQAGQISGYVLDDQTGDGFSPDDKALDLPVMIDLYLNGSAAPVASTQTYPGGWYTFTFLWAGVYTVQERVPAGYTLTAQTGAAIYIFSGTHSWDNNFDNYFSSFAVTMTGIEPVEGAGFTGTVATLRARPGAVASDFTATIAWGDGVSSAGGVTSNPSGGFLVSGQHTYTEEGVYNLELTVNSATGLSATGSQSVAVADAPLHASGQALTATRSAAFAGAVATFTDDDPNGEVGDYSASISWGDGTTSSGAVSTGFVVSGSHTFGEGRFTITTTIHDLGGASAVATCTITVDLTAPTTSATVTRLHNQAVVTLTATDNLTGIRALYYTINGGPTQQYSGPFALKGNKTTTVSYWSVDGVGNIETAHTNSV